MLQFSTLETTPRVLPLLFLSFFFSLGLDQIKEACDYLSFVKMVITAHNGAQPSFTPIRPHTYKVYRTMAKMYLVKEEYQQSIENLAEDVSHHIYIIWAFFLIYLHKKFSKRYLTNPKIYILIPFHETKAVRTLTSHLKNHPSKTNKTCGTPLEE